MQQSAILVFLSGSLLQLSRAAGPSYGDGICSGTICAQITYGGSIECINDPGSNTNPGNVLFKQDYVEAGSDTVISAWGDVAINPLDGTIYVIYKKTIAGTTNFLGTIVDPLTLPSTGGTYEVTPIGALTHKKYSGMTFDCKGNLYGVSSDTPATIYQFDYNSGTNIDSSLIDTISNDHRCIRSNPASGVECIESLFYNFQDKIFYRISSASGEEDIFFGRNNIKGPDMPVDGTDMPGSTSVCGDKDSIQYTAAFYIGNELSIISCRHYNTNIYLLSGTPVSSSFVTSISNTGGMSSGADGLWNYNDDNIICKSPLCTEAPTSYPTTIPSAQPSITPTAIPTATSITPTAITDIPTATSITPTATSITPTATPTAITDIPTATPTGDDDDDNDDDDESSDSSGSSDGALMSENKFDNGLGNYGNNERSDTITVNLSDQSIFNLWGLFGAFTIVNIIAFWCYYKRNANKVKFVTQNTPTIDL